MSEKRNVIIVISSFLVVFIIAFLLWFFSSYEILGMNVYPKNSAGYSYGSIGYAIIPDDCSPDDEYAYYPDLIAVVNNDGLTGYVWKEDLFPPLPSNPAEAAEYIGSSGPIPMYENDGITQIGYFEA